MVEHDPSGGGKLPEAVGPYRVLGLLGEGGMGVVYLAEQRVPVRRRVAVKVVKLGMDTKAVLARFDAERQALSMMNHDAIARVHDCGVTAAGQPYFAMEYVKGVPITEYCDRNSLPLVERLVLFQQVCAGVQHAHLKGVMHRDLKPGNVLVEIQDGKAAVKIIDFGLAKAIDHRLVEATIFTQQGQVVGTPEYMSPEQAGLDGLDVDTRTDVYSLGVLLYELLTGQLPFSRQELLRAGWLELQRLLREQEPPRPSTRVTMLGPSAEAVARARRLDTAALMRQLRGDLDWVVLRALEKDRTRRYATPGELAADLGRFLAQEPVLACPPSTGYRLRKLLARHRGKVTAAAAILMTIVVGTVVAVSQAWEARHQAGIAEQNARRADERAGDADRERRRADEEAKRAFGLAEAATGNAYVANMTAAMMAFEAGDDAVVRSRLGTAPVELRGWEWRQLDASLHNWIVEVPGTAAAFSPDGKQLAVARGSEVHFVNPRTGADGRILRGSSQPIASLAFRADGAQIALAHRDASVAIVDIATDRVERTLSPGTAEGEGPRAVAFSSDGTMVLVVGSTKVADRYESWTLVWPAGGGESVRFLGAGEFMGPKHRLLVLRSGPPPNHRDEATVLDGVPLREVGRWATDDATSSRDGESLVFHSWSAVRVWRLGATSVADFTHSRGRLSGENGLCLDDRVLYSVYDGTVLLRNLADKAACDELATGLVDCCDTTVSRDGTRLLVKSRRGLAQVWDLVSGTRLGEVRGSEGYADLVATAGLDLVAQATYLPVGPVVRVWNTGAADTTTRIDDVVAVGPELERVAQKRRTVAIHRIADGACLQTVVLEPSEYRVGWCEITETLVTTREGVLRQRSRDGTRLLRQYRRAERDVRGATLRPGGELVVLTDDGRLRGWDLRSGEAVWEFAAGGMSHEHLEISDDGRHLACSAWAAGATVYDLRERRTLRSLTGSFIGFSPAGSAATMDENGARLWDLGSGQPGPSLPGKRIRWDAQGDRCVCWSPRSTASPTVCDGRTGAVLWTLADRISDARLSPDGSRVLTVSYDQNDLATARLWDAVNGQFVRTLVTDPRWIDVGGPDTYLVWDAEAVRIFRGDGTEVGRIDCRGDEREVVGPGRAHLLVEHDFVVVQEVEDRSRAATFDSWDQVLLDRTGKFALGSTTRGLQLREWATGRMQDLDDEDLDIRRASFSPDSSRLVFASRDGASLFVRETADAARLATVALPNEIGAFAADAMTWSPDGRWLAVAGAQVCVVEVARAAVVKTVPVAAREVAFSADGTRMACAADICIVLETTTWDQQLALEGFWIGVAFAPSGHRFATRSYRDVAIWDTVTTGRIVGLELPRDPRALAWSPDGARLATGGEDHVVRVWNSATGAELGQLRGLGKEVHRVVWSRDGTRLMALDRDGGACIWDSVRRADRNAMANGGRR